MEELKNKVFLVKIPKDVFDYLKEFKESPESKIGNLEIFLNKKRKNKPDFNLKFNKKNGLNNFSLNFNKMNDYFYFYDQEKKEDMKLYNVDNFGKLIIKDEKECNKLIENIVKEESNKSKDIAVKRVKDIEKQIDSPKEIHLTDKKYANTDKKVRRIKKDQNEVDKYIIDNVPKNPYITAKEIADDLDIPESQAKETLKRLCEEYTEKSTRRKLYKLRTKNDNLKSNNKI